MTREYEVLCTMETTDDHCAVASATQSVLNAWHPIQVFDASASIGNNRTTNVVIYLESETEPGDVFHDIDCVDEVNELGTA